MISWLSIIKASTIGWTPLAQKTLPNIAHGTHSSISDRIVINISGKRYICLRSTLEKYPDTLLGSDEKEFFYDEQNDEYFIERDPELFKYILTFYRTGRLHFQRNDCLFAYEDELAFFGINADFIGDCCYEDYINKKKEVTIDLLREENKNNLTTIDIKKLDNTFRKRLWRRFENPQKSTVALVFYYVTGFFIGVSLIANISETIRLTENLTLGEKYRDIFFALDSACVFIFTLEYLLRLYASPERIKYMCSVMSIIDAVAVLPYYISLVIVKNDDLSGAFVTLRIFRVFRIFKFSRHSQGLKILGKTLKSCVNELGFLLFSLAMVIIIFGTIMYYAEKNVENSKFTSIPSAFWYTIVTMTTLGYGDMVPKTPIGKIFGAICSLSGVLVIALPVPVIVSNFSRIYHQSQRAAKMKLQKKVQIQLKKEYLAQTNNHYIQAKKNFSTGRGIYEQQKHHLLSCLENTVNKEFAELGNNSNLSNYHKRQKSVKIKIIDKLMKRFDEEESVLMKEIKSTSLNESKNNENINIVIDDTEANCDISHINNNNSSSINEPPDKFLKFDDISIIKNKNQ